MASETTKPDLTGRVPYADPTGDEAVINIERRPDGILEVVKRCDLCGTNVHAFVRFGVSSPTVHSKQTIVIENGWATHTNVVDGRWRSLTSPTGEVERRWVQRIPGPCGCRLWHVDEIKQLMAEQEHRRQGSR